ALGLGGPAAADCAVPGLLRAASASEDKHVRQAAVGALPGLLARGAAGGAVRAVLRAAAEDQEWEVRLAAVAALPRLLGPGAAGEALPVLLQVVTEDLQDEVRREAMDALSKLGGVEAAERVMLNLSRAVTTLRASGGGGTAAVVGREQGFRHLSRLADFFWKLEPAALEPLVPTLMLALSAALPYMSSSRTARREGADIPAKRSSPEASFFAIKVGRTLAKVASAAGPDVLDILRKAEEVPYMSHNAVLHLRSSREIVQGSLELKCANLFKRESGIESVVGNLTVEVPFGVMMTSDAHGTHAHKCPNPHACSVPRRRTMRPAEDSTKTETMRCPLRLDEHDEAAGEDRPMCASGFDPATPGCTKCLPGFGRKSTDPFACERCRRSGSAEKWAAWLAQPLLLFLLSMRSAENAAASRGMAEALANDVVKIVLAYLSSISVVVSSVTSTAAFRELNATDRAREVLKLTRKTAQHGDVTYSSSSDCSLMDGKGAASVDRLLALSLQLPACVLAIVVLLLAARACCRAALSGGTLGLEELRAEVASGLVTSSLVAGNQFLPGVASACMRALPCFHTQAAVDGQDLVQLMVYDPDAECRARLRHLAACGPALALAFAAGPGYWRALLRRQQGAPRAGPVRFLTGSYRAGFHWWEAGRLSKTMLIACFVTASPTSYCPLQSGGSSGRLSPSLAGAILDTGSVAAPPWPGGQLASPDPAAHALPPRHRRLQLVALLPLPVQASRAQRRRGRFAPHAQRQHGALGDTGRQRVVTHPWLQEQHRRWNRSRVDPLPRRARGPLGKGQVLLDRGRRRRGSCRGPA
ncbi:unnamed protein product, partial [Prorocentrum cordatum]